LVQYVSWGECLARGKKNRVLGGSVWFGPGNSTGEKESKAGGEKPEAAKKWVVREQKRVLDRG